MNTWQKILVGFLAALAWVGSILLGHQYPDLVNDLSQVKLAAQAVITGLGVWHLSAGNQAGAAPPAGGDLPPVTAATPSAQSGFARLSLLGLLVVVSLLSLTACGTVNTYTGALLTHAESDYAGAKKNAQAKDDLQFRLWADAACTMPLGALARSASDNPGAIEAALKACPVSGAVVPAAASSSGSKPQPVAASPASPSAIVPQ